MIRALARFVGLRMEAVRAMVTKGMMVVVMTLGFTTGMMADVDVKFDDSHREAFTYDLVTNELTPAAGATARRREDIDRPRATCRA
jgi:hypothetical protein